MLPISRVLPLALILCAAVPGIALAQAASPELEAGRIRTLLERSADWQLANPTGKTVLTDWVAAPLYDGLLRLAAVTGEPRYLSAVVAFGSHARWSPGPRRYHADDIAVGHAWLDVYAMDTAHAGRLAPVKERLDAVLAAPVDKPLDFRRPKEFPGYEATDRWTWCDSLYMAPPTYSRLARITGDPRYLAFMDREFHYTYDVLYDHSEHLFFRDGTLLAKRAPNGRKIFWSRGNGWVFGGLALMLETLPADYPGRPFYEQLFREMSGAVLAAQQPDGLWRPSLLDPAQIPVGETSGSGFFVFGLAWGVNHGLLDRQAVWPAIIRGWKGLESRVKPDGYVGYVQRIGFAPDDVGPDSRQDYGTGALLLAGSEILRALGAAVPPADPARFLERAQPEAQRALGQVPSGDAGRFLWPIRPDSVR